MHHLLKQVAFTAFLYPLITLGMDVKPNKIELGKQLAKAALSADWNQVQILIREGADLNQTIGGEYTALMLAIHVSIMRYHQIRVDNPSVYSSYSDSYHESPLTSEAYWYAINIPRMLIDAGANLNLKNELGETALMVAARNDCARICWMIVEAQLAQIARQKELVYTTLNCLKRVPGGQYSNLRNIFKPIFKDMVKKTGQNLLDDINQIQNDQLKRGLLKHCNLFKRHDRSSRCIIL